MRFKLKNLVGSELEFEATIKGFGRRPTKPYRRTVLLKNVYLNGEFYFDHVWVERTIDFNPVRYEDRILIRATVVNYRHNYKGPGKSFMQHDFGLECTGGLKIIARKCAQMRRAARRAAADYKQEEINL